ncbi:MAG: TetR/AcrR family transcriptional regulator [Sphingomonas bacterium]
MIDLDDPRSIKLIREAHEIIRETGTFELPMRQLASRAQVSLRTLYDLFHSKSGVITAILRSDQSRFASLVKQAKSENPIERLFDRVALAMRFYSRDQPFYRALFRATQGFSDTEEMEPAREVLPIYTILCRKAIEAGCIRPEIAPESLAEALTDLFAANLRNWALNDFDIMLAGNRICFGDAIALAGVATDEWLPSIRGRALDFQRSVQALEEAEKRRIANDAPPLSAQPGR